MYTLNLRISDQFSDLGKLICVSYMNIAVSIAVVFILYFIHSLMYLLRIKSKIQKKYEVLIILTTKIEKIDLHPCAN